MSNVSEQVKCYHCGAPCKSDKHDIGSKSFCCGGCRSVYLLLSTHEMEDYYCLNEQPGVNIKDVAPEKFRFLDDEAQLQKLLGFNNGNQASITLYLPQIHCSSCLWLLEHLDRLNPHILTSRVNFAGKTITITFAISRLTLRQLATLLTGIGYEPHFSTSDEHTTTGAPSKAAAYKIGITGFCFANIMLISFPEYLGLSFEDNRLLGGFFRWANLFLALPVFFYGASEFFRNALLSIKQRYLNIDAPIALAIAITFGRSLYEIGTGSGAGYLDSMSGIVFFMLLGRYLQNRTYRTLNFKRDYKSYFPVALTIRREGKEQVIPIKDIRAQDVLMLHHQEIIPADCILSRGKARIDYSFITGESTPEHPGIGALLYAGGKVTGGAIEVLAVKDFSQNSFMQLWNQKSYRQQSATALTTTTERISRYFSMAVLLVAFSAFFYWQYADTANAWNALTAVLIVACPCSLLLTTTFTNGYLMASFAASGFFLRDAQVIEDLSRSDHITFDKTGTLTEARQNAVRVMRMRLDAHEKELMFSVLSQSLHPLSKAIIAHYRYKAGIFTGSLKEIPGKGLEAWLDERHIRIGSRSFVTNNEQRSASSYSEVFVSIDGAVKAHFICDNQVRTGVTSLLRKLKDRYTLSLVSGDNESSRRQLAALFPEGSTLLYHQSPAHKLQHIQALQQEGKKVIMIGDGLNDAGALRQSNTGIAVVQDSFAFCPACDAIIEAGKLPALPEFLKQAGAAQRMIMAGFGYSLCFNIAGLSFAVTAQLSPVVAAILMPSSSLGIILIAWIGIKRISRRKHHLSSKDDEDHTGG